MWSEHLRQMQRHDKIDQSQHGVEMGRSCLTNLLEFFEEVNSRTDKGESVDVSLDFQKAFDKVPNDRLLRKISAHGIKDHILAWIAGWPNGRRQGGNKGRFIWLATSE